MRVSDHAVLRYLERQLGVDVEGVRVHIQEIFEPSRMRAATMWVDGAGMRVVRGGMVFCCRNNTVTTCYGSSARRPLPRRSEHRGGMDSAEGWQGGV